jgi:hypothetical protein
MKSCHEFYRQAGAAASRVPVPNNILWAGRLLSFVALAAACMLSAAVPANAVDIAWVSFHPADNMPSSGATAADIAFTTAPDKGYTDVLTAAGHNVTRFVTSDNPDENVLNTFDLVIISRSVNSGHYELDAETKDWNTNIGAPTMIMGGYVLRNIRLGYTTGGTIPDTGGAINLQVNNTAHPIFAGIPLTGNVTTNTYTSGLPQMTTGSMSVQRGISVNTDPVTGNGTVLATVAGTTDPAAGGMIVGEWQPGAIMGTTPADILGGHRVVFLSGSREHAATTTPVAPSSSEIAGMFDLSPTGQQMFLNAVSYTAGRGFVVAGDVNRNGVTDINDYNIIRDNFLGTGKTRAQGDLIGDGTVNFADFRYWKNNRTAGAAGSELGDAELLAGLGVPEPGSLALVLLGALAWLSSSRRRAG